MRGEPSPGELHQPPMESGVGKPVFDAFDISLRQAAFHYAQQDIHQIAFAEHFDQRVVIIPILSNLVVRVDHQLDFRNPSSKVILF